MRLLRTTFSAFATLTGCGALYLAGNQVYESLQRQNQVEVGTWVIVAICCAVFLSWKADSKDDGLRRNRRRMVQKYR